MSSESLLSKHGASILTILIAICGIAVSWGSAKSEVSSVETSVVQNQNTISTIDTRVRDLEIKDATNSQVLKNILEKLESIQNDVKDIKQGKHGG